MADQWARSETIDPRIADEVHEETLDNTPLRRYSQDMGGKRTPNKLKIGEGPRKLLNKLKERSQEPNRGAFLEEVQMAIDDLEDSQLSEHQDKILSFFEENAHLNFDHLRRLEDDLVEEGGKEELNAILRPLAVYCKTNFMEKIRLIIRDERPEWSDEKEMEYELAYWNVAGMISVIHLFMI